MSNRTVVNKHLCSTLHSHNTFYLKQNKVYGRVLLIKKL